MWVFTLMTLWAVCALIWWVRPKRKLVERVTIRSMEEKDVNRIYYVLKQLYNYVPKRKYLEQIELGANSISKVAEVGNRFVGWISAHRNDDDIIIKILFVDPACPFNLDELLLSAVMKIPARRHHRFLSKQAATYQSNLAFYQRHGFRIVDEGDQKCHLEK
jgi:hypothetical protein